MANKFKITEKDKDRRLDVFLAKKLKISRSQAQKMIEADQILVNDKLPKKAGDNLKTGNVINFRLQTSDFSNKNADKSQSEVRRPTAEVQIMAVTPDYIIVNKPTGMLAHPTMAKEKNTLADFMVKKYPEIKKVGDDPLRPGIVHRLDKEASGLMVVARTQNMFNHLKEQFKNRTVNKEYLALAHGRVARDWGEINFPISRSKTNDRMAAVPLKLTAAQMTVTPPTPPLGKGMMRISPSSQEGTVEVAEDDSKQAKTEFTLEKKFINFILLRVKIHTGRMHQIRVHLFAYNHPLVGDPLYFQKKQKRTWDEKLGRLFLHSTKLGFTDLEGNKQEFELPLPKELTEFLKLLK
jgi:23S rRNA pseudouridine1911/1915/1917 synthase